MKPPNNLIKVTNNLKKATVFVIKPLNHLDETSYICNERMQLR